MTSRSEQEDAVAVLRVLKTHLAFELVERYIIDVERFCSILLEVLDLGTLAAKVFIVMYQHRLEWTTVELAGTVRDHRSNVYVTLRLLERKGFVQRVSRNKWRFSGIV